MQNAKLQFENDVLPDHGGSGFPGRVGRLFQVASAPTTERRGIRNLENKNYFARKRWLVAPKRSNNLIEQVLINRDIEKADWEKFLKPDFEHDRGDPMLIKGMRPAVNKILSAIDKGRTIGLFADYDADGIPAAAIIDQTIRYLSHKLTGQLTKPPVYIPSREEGYGLNKPGIDWLKSQGVTLLITLDLGVKSSEEIDYARSQGLDCIIIDHHLLGESPPKAATIINPKQSSDRYPFKDFSAGGLAWKLAEALLFNTSGVVATPEVKNKNQPEHFGSVLGHSQSGKKGEAFLKWLLDLAAISTMCDMVPLLGENRLIAKYGLIVLQKARRLGLQSIYETARLKPEVIDPYHVGFLIGPRINAPGRLDHASPAFRCLVSNDPKEARRLADELDQVNRARQLELGRVLAEARAVVIKNKLHERKVILVSGRDWPKGIVGLVAGKLMEEFARPAIVLSKEERVARGSARSIKAFHIVEAFDHTSRYLIKYGGHAKAAGLTVENQHLEALYDLLLEYAEQKLTNEDLVPTITIDAKLESQQITLSLLDDLKKLEPHGVGNPRPIFLIEKLIVRLVRPVGKEGSHIKLTLGAEDSSLLLPTIYFNGSRRLTELKIGGMIDCVVILHEDRWHNQRRVDVHMVDFRPTPRV